MGIDLLRGGRIANKNRRVTKSSNAYIKLLIKLYSFLSRRTESTFNKVILRRLNQSNLTRYPLSLSRLAKNLKDRKDAPIVALVGTITNDNRLLEVPKGMKVAALKFTEAARSRILSNGGEVLTFDQLAQRAPTGKNVLLLRGPRSREALRHFGPAPGARGSHTAPYVRSEGRKFEMARGRR